MELGDHYSHMIKNIFPRVIYVYILAKGFSYGEILNVEPNWVMKFKLDMDKTSSSTICS